MKKMFNKKMKTNCEKTKNSIKNLKFKTKKAQTEIMEDIPAFLVVIFILLLLVAFSLIFYTPGEKIKQEQESKILYDKISAMLIAALNEKQDDNLRLIDKIRIKDESAKHKIEQEVNKICSEENYDYECFLEIHYEDFECKSSENSLDYFCIYIPGENTITIKFLYFKFEGTLPA